jgi:hypothetical protein
MHVSIPYDEVQWALLCIVGGWGIVIGRSRKGIGPHLDRRVRSQMQTADVSSEVFLWEK